jgi:hypothetical protein
MKMQTVHFDYIAEKIAALDTPALRAAYKDAGLSLKRYQWDMTWKAGLSAYICDTLYPYLNDDHIQTALNRIIPAI